MGVRLNDDDVAG